MPLFQAGRGRFVLGVTNNLSAHFRLEHISNGKPQPVTVSYVSLARTVQELRPLIKVTVIDLREEFFVLFCFLR